MVDVPDALRYTKDHEWLRVEGDEAVVGITAYAADELGDVVFVELPEVGRKLQASEAFGVIESVKTASDLYAPLAGEIIAINDALDGGPELVNSEPYEAGWIRNRKPYCSNIALAAIERRYTRYPTAIGFAVTVVATG